MFQKTPPCNNVFTECDLILKISWPEKSRIAEWEFIARAQVLGRDDPSIKGHIPEVKYGRDFDEHSTSYIRDFLKLQSGKTSNTRILRLIVMNRLYPLHHLEAPKLWRALWECFECAYLCPASWSLPIRFSGHYRLWLNGISHGDISPPNLMCTLSPTGEPVGVLNDYDLASWREQPTENGDRTGTIPFMAIPLLAGLDERSPRLYGYDAESFIWSLAYFSIAQRSEDEGDKIKLTRPPCLQPWFERHTQGHISLKLAFPCQIDGDVQITDSYERYTFAIRYLTKFWTRRYSKMTSSKGAQTPESQYGDPCNTLQDLLDYMEKKARKGPNDNVFAEVETRLKQAMERPLQLHNA